ncbi:MAG: hypothetical protein HC899_07615 [Leptolyngbyaceae cyanobacterium SM1_4_3]|nr:hypothetical protein [Leptolyngbyaceae cyanobacterium SM1_4_3]
MARYSTKLNKREGERATLSLPLPFHSEFEGGVIGDRPSLPAYASAA